MNAHSKNSFSRKLTVSYIVVFLIPLLLSAVVYVTAASYTHQYSEKMLESELRGNEKFVQDLLTELNNTYFAMLNDATVRAALSGEIPTPSQYNTLRNQFALSSSQSGGLFSDVFVYFEEADYVMGLFGGDTVTNYYEAATASYLQSEPEWRAMMQSFHAGNLVRTKNGILYLKSLNENAEQSALTLGIEIPASRLASRGDAVKLYGETNLILLDDQNQLVFSSMGELPSSLQLDTLLRDLPEHATQKITRGGVRYIANRSSFYRFDYLILVQEDGIVARLKLLLLTIFIVTLAAFFIGGLVIRRFVLNRTRPVREILDLLGSSGTEGGEFEQIQQGITRNLHHIMQSRPFLVDSFISHVIRGNVDAAVPLEFPHAQFQFILLRAGDMGIYTPEDGDDAKSLRELMYTAVINIFDELLGELGCVYHSIQAETLVFLLNTETEARVDDVEHAYRQVHDYLGVGGYVALSPTCQDLGGLQGLWQEAIRRLDGAEMRGLPGVEQGPENVPAGAGGGYQKYINQFTTAVAGGQPQQAQGAVRGMIQTCAENRKNMNDVKFNLLTMMNDAARELERLTQTDVKSKLYETNLAYKVIEAKSTALLLEITDEFLALVSGLPGADLGQTPLEERVASYIRAHYDDSNLNLKILADKFHMSPAYLSQKFKAHFGTGILDYLSSTRLETAKQKLLETDWSIERISECCGYTNTVTFSRQFKSYTGMTPGRFRQAHEALPPEA